MMDRVRHATHLTQAREAAQAFQGKDRPLITNLQTGIQVKVTRNNLDKMLSESAVRKSSSVADHALAVANLDTLFGNAIYGWTKPDRDNDPNLKGIHRFFALMHTSDGMRLVKLTVKEFGRADQGVKIYSVEVLHIKSPASNWVDSTVRGDGLDPTSTPYAGRVGGLIESIQQRNRCF